MSTKNGLWEGYKVLQQLEKHMKGGFKDLANLLSLLAPCLWLRLWRLVFSQHRTKIRQIC